METPPAQPGYARCAYGCATPPCDLYLCVPPHPLTTALGGFAIDGCSREQQTWAEGKRSLLWNVRRHQTLMEGVELKEVVVRHIEGRFSVANYFHEV